MRNELVGQLQAMAADRAGGGPSETNYDPELLNVLFEAADEIERLQMCIDWLEEMARRPGGILLHAETSVGRLGLGLGPACGNRGLRKAISYAIGSQPSKAASGSPLNARSD